MRVFRNLAGLSALMVLAGCNIAGLTAPQVAAVNCVLASDGATVVAIARPGLALPAAAGAKVGCDAGTQLGQIIGAK
jgi:hypothetical protein